MLAGNRTHSKGASSTCLSPFASLIHTYYRTSSPSLSLLCVQEGHRLCTPGAPCVLRVCVFAFAWVSSCACVRAWVPRSLVGTPPRVNI